MIDLSPPKRSSLRQAAFKTGNDRPPMPSFRQEIDHQDASSDVPEKQLNLPAKAPNRRTFASKVPVWVRPDKGETKQVWFTGKTSDAHSEIEGIPPVSSIAVLFWFQVVEACRSILRKCFDVCTSLWWRLTDDHSNEILVQASSDALGRITVVWKDMYAENMQVMHKDGDQLRLHGKQQQRIFKACTRIGIGLLVMILLILLGGAWLLAMGRPWIMCRSGNWDEHTYKHVKAVSPWKNGHWGVEYVGPTVSLAALGSLAFAVIATGSFILMLMFFQRVLSTIRSTILFVTGMYLTLVTGAFVSYSVGDGIVCASRELSENLLSLIGCPMLLMSCVCLQYFFALQASTLQPAANCLHFWIAHLGGASAMLKCCAEMMTAPVLHDGRFAWGEAPDNDDQIEYADTMGFFSQFGTVLTYAILSSGGLAAISNIQAYVQLSPLSPVLQRFRLRLLCNAACILLTAGSTILALVSGSPSPTSQAVDMPQGSVYLIYAVQVTFGIVCVSALSGLMIGHRSKEHPTLANITINDRLKRLPQAAHSLAKQLGYSLGDHIDVLQAPLKAAAKIHIAALKKVAAREPQPLWHLLHLEQHHMYAGLLLSDDEAGGRIRDLVTQDSEILDELMEDALRAQAFLKNMFIPKTAKLKRARPKGMFKRMQMRRQEAKAAAKTRSPLLEFVSSSFENGVKDPDAVRRKANLQSRVVKGVPSQIPSLNRIFDIARVTLQVRKAHHLLLLVCGLTQLFDVVAIENRFARPSALGFMDVTVLVRLALDTGHSHIAEIRVELIDICQARIAATSCVDNMRSSLQYFGVSSVDVEQALRIIFQALES
eukprot:gnl/MRDRNA2_/MRDRNA2_26032_c0_seq1.p1 gnl/MRDRNA2_/MRDRNA2_26032_c0~~gnl/MRDRNA2_/MRDRNA2_26032_c0_seq1.p1  ORF type:complete len:826 (+),score=128.58 gnl/MRDRNA2_/MRDRNA2_26032_c0_seq1:181-2658(+)